MSAKRSRTSAGAAVSSRAPSTPRVSAATLSALVIPTTCAASYHIASPVIPCSFPAAVCALTQYSQALTPLTAAATISFSPRVNSPGAMAPPEPAVPCHHAAHGGRLGEIVIEPGAAQLEELLSGRGILGGGSESDGRHGFPPVGVSRFRSRSSGERREHREDVARRETLLGGSIAAIDDGEAGKGTGELQARGD